MGVEYNTARMLLEPMIGEGGLPHLDPAWFDNDRIRFDIIAGLQWNWSSSEAIMLEAAFQLWNGRSLGLVENVIGQAVHHLDSQNYQRFVMALLIRGGVDLSLGKARTMP